MKRTLALLPLVLVTLASLLWSQNPPQLPKPGLEHQRLHYYVGDWKTEAEAKPSPFGPGGKFTVNNHNEMLGDFFVCVSAHPDRFELEHRISSAAKCAVIIAQDENAWSLIIGGRANDSS